jgi:predicted HicB family RNase H-like nuclease
MAEKKDDARDANLRVSRRVHNSLKTAAALMGRPLYDVTSEAIDAYLSNLQLDPVAAIRRTGRSRKSP